MYNMAKEIMGVIFPVKEKWQSLYATDGNLHSAAISLFPLFCCFCFTAVVSIFSIVIFSKNIKIPGIACLGNPGFFLYIGKRKSKYIVQSNLKA